MNRIPFLLLLLASLSLSACTEYWWTRGQAPGVDELLSRANAQLEENTKSSPYKRAELNSSDLSTAVNNAYEASKTEANVSAELQRVVDTFGRLEGLVSVTSRAPYAELSGQARALLAQAEKGQADSDAIGLFAARTVFFLAREIRVPAPSFGA